jgi:hypothetical protein
MPFFNKGREGGFDAGVEQLIAAVLVSPEFLYRTTHTPAAPLCHRKRSGVVQRIFRKRR